MVPGQPVFGDLRRYNGVEWKLGPGGADRRLVVKWSGVEPGGKRAVSWRVAGWREAICLPGSAEAGYQMTNTLFFPPCGKEAERKGQRERGRSREGKVSCCDTSSGRLSTHAC